METHIDYLKKALEYFEYSFEKVKTLPKHVKDLDHESLETWKSFAARFARASDLFLGKYLRGKILESDPGFRGSFRDMLNQGAKLGFIEDETTWLKIRELRNTVAHEYNNQAFDDYISFLLKYAPHIISIKELIKR
ncbi:MAG: nucleotidyltransferase substrate binding protein [Deltaproteobacteria bacterium]|nr:nucleotidyltransferase substrate binding protein [Deltaproteobacteria bacterium]